MQMKALVGAFLLGGGVLAACANSDTLLEGVEGPDASTSTAKPAEEAGLPSPDFGGKSDATTPPVDPVVEPDAGVKEDDAEAEEDGSASSSDGETDAELDAGVAVDSGPVVYDPPGSPCAVESEVQRRRCGKCGEEARVCLADDTGKVVWQPWGPCRGEVPNGCTPGEVVNEECGNCGIRTSICQNDCRIRGGTCVEPATSVCAPGDIEFSPGLSCDDGLGRWHRCHPRDAGAQGCTWAAFSGCTPGAPTRYSLEIPAAAAVGDVAASDYELSVATKQQPVLDTANTYNRAAPCPRTLRTTTSSRYAYIAIENKTSLAARVSLWTSQAQAPGAPSYLDTVIAAYARDTEPSTDADRMACTGWVNDDCSKGPCSTSGSFAGLAGDLALDGGASDASVPDSGAPAWAGATPIIPAGGKIVVYVGLDYQSSTMTSAAFRLNAKVEELK